MHTLQKEDLAFPIIRKLSFVYVLVHSGFVIRCSPMAESLVILELEFLHIRGGCSQTFYALMQVWPTRSSQAACASSPGSLRLLITGIYNHFQNTFKQIWLLNFHAVQSRTVCGRHLKWMQLIGYKSLEVIHIL